MKNKITLLLCAAASIALLTTGCAQKPNPSAASSQPAQSQPAQSQSSQSGSGADSPAGTASMLGSLQSFTALTLDGESFTQDDIAAKDITVLNFWALTCPPCIAEMPELASFAGALPDNVQVVTVCLDGSGNEETVSSILDEAGFSGVTLVAGDGDLAALAGNLMYTPTTLVADSAGTLMGDPIIGGQKDLPGTFLAAVNDALQAGGKAEVSLED